jgi:hypothetical protein
MSLLMMTQSKTALAPNLGASFLASGGTAPYTYSVRVGGAGGTIDPFTGVYTAPPVVQDDPAFLYDTIQVKDAFASIAVSSILVGDPLLLFCEVIQRELGLAPGRVFLWDQKIFQPTDADLYIAVSVPSCKPFSSINRPDPVLGWSNPIQIVNMLAMLDLDIMSRGPSARKRKEEIVLAMNSVYAQSQQEANSFYIGKLPPGARFTNLSAIDGAAIPYRFRISTVLQYSVTKTKAVPYFDTFQSVQVTTEA